MNEVFVEVGRARKKMTLDRNIHCDRKGGRRCGMQLGEGTFENQMFAESQARLGRI